MSDPYSHKEEAETAMAELVEKIHELCDDYSAHIDVSCSEAMWFTTCEYKGLSGKTLILEH